MLSRAVLTSRMILVCRFSGGGGIVTTEALYVHIQLAFIGDCSFTEDLCVRGGPSCL